MYVNLDQDCVFIMLSINIPNTTTNTFFTVRICNFFVDYNMQNYYINLTLL